MVEGFTVPSGGENLKLSSMTFIMLKSAHQLPRFPKVK